MAANGDVMIFAAEVALTGALNYFGPVWIAAEEPFDEAGSIVRIWLENGGLAVELPRKFEALRSSDIKP
jgi:hypothetical protein